LCVLKSVDTSFDNGREFCAHEKLASVLKAKTYFATPYHSWERRLNEQTNGLVRQYFPKKKSFGNISHEQVQFVEDKLNHRPRKCLVLKHHLRFSTKLVIK